MNAGAPLEADLRYKKVLAPAPGMWRLPLEAFFEDVGEFSRFWAPSPDVEAIAGWGRKPASAYSRWLAARLAKPYFAVEDGFVRSVAVGEDGAPPVSLVADDIGIYYDATRPSRLERLIAEAAARQDGALAAEARALMALKTHARLSKYNNAEPLGAAQLPRGDRPIALIVDQTGGDASVVFSGARPGAFSAMLDAAIEENPGAHIIVKRHPVSVAGFKSSYIPTRGGVTYVERAVDLIELLETVDVVYTVSSLAGFEALLLGRKVVCFGAPFYAGWGLTDDRAPIPPRRAARPSIEALFAAAYMAYARYVDPLTGEACSARLAFERLATMKDHARRLRGSFVAVNFAPAKKRVLRSFFGAPTSRLRFGAPRPGGEERSLVWASRMAPEEMERLRARRAVVAVEDGFLRSVGLGSDFYPAASFVFDETGIYYDPSRPSDLETLLQSAAFTPALVERARALAARIVELGISKYNLNEAAPPAFARKAGQKLILAPGQVGDDASVLRGGGDVRTNEALLRAVRSAEPSAFIAYKEHPDVTAGNRPGALSAATVARYADVFVRAVDIGACIAAADEVHTISSLTGFEALLRGKRVVAYGMPFYAGWGVTTDRMAINRRTRRLTREELIAGALLLYPLYVDPVSGLPCSPEALIDRLAQMKAAQTKAARRPAAGRRPFGVRYARALKEAVGARRPPIF